VLGVQSRTVEVGFKVVFTSRPSNATTGLVGENTSGLLLPVRPRIPTETGAGRVCRTKQWNTDQEPQDGIRLACPVRQEHPASSRGQGGIMLTASFRKSSRLSDCRDRGPSRDPRKGPGLGDDTSVRSFTGSCDARGGQIRGRERRRLILLHYHSIFLGQGKKRPTKVGEMM
jgi:hypothetical protein